MSRRFRILCLNAWGGRFQPELTAYLAASEADVICLQEVIHTPAPPAPMLRYRDDGMDLPQRADMFDDLRRALPGYHATFCPAARGALWHGSDRVETWWGLATFVRRAVPVIAQAQGFVHGGFGPDGFGDHPRSRTGHALRVWADALDGAVSLAQMHGLRDLGGKHDTPARTAQAHRFAKMLRHVAEPDDLRLACGDFNVLPDSETLRILAADGLTELVTSHGHPGTRTRHYTKPQPFADYMAISDPSRIAAFHVVRDPDVSDHCPLVLDLGAP